MAEVIFTKQDIQELAERMNERAWSELVLDMPELQHDLRLCSALLNWFVKWQVLSSEVYPVEVKTRHGTI